MKLKPAVPVQKSIENLASRMGMNLKNLFRWSEKRQLDSLESQLGSAFTAIGPSAEFVSRLRDQIVQPETGGVLGLGKAGWALGALVVGAVLGLVLLAQTGLKLLIALVGGASITQRERQRARLKQGGPSDSR